MSKLIFKLNYSGKRWADYLPEILGKEIAEKCVTESEATAKSHMARIIIYDFNGDKKVINKLTSNEHAVSVYLVENNKVQKIFK